MRALRHRARLLDQRSRAPEKETAMSIELIESWRRSREADRAAMGSTSASGAANARRTQVERRSEPLFLPLDVGHYRRRLSGLGE